MEVYKLDSIEDGISALESPDGMMIYLKAKRLPEGSKSGDCFIFENGNFVFSPEETEKRRAVVSGLLEELMKGN